MSEAYDATHPDVDPPTITVRKVGGCISISDVLLNPENYPTPTRRKQLRWWWQDWRAAHTPHMHLGPCDHRDCW